MILSKWLGHIHQLQWNPPYDHPVYKTTSLLWPYSFKPNVKTIESFYYFEDPVNRTTSLLRPGFYGPKVVALKGFHCSGIRVGESLVWVCVIVWTCCISWLSRPRLYVFLEEHVHRILRARLNGKACLVCKGWHNERKSYWWWRL